MAMKIVTRFAPSPTGFMHVGGVRTALFAWLVARKNKGTFILRIEDTDKTREVEGSIAHIIKTLESLEIDYDEGPNKPGPNAPYLQSERLDIYKEWANKLIEKGRAYADPYTSEQVNEFREEAKANKRAFLFRDYRPENPPKWDGKTALRFKSDPKPYKWHDEIMGDLSAGPEAVDDYILIKADGYPTYNFAHIVDDMLMNVTHIIRAQEFIASVPRFLNLYEAMELTPPILATVPPVLGPDGKKKLSKRDGAKDVLEYLKDGYLVETLINFMASLGWNDGTTQEIYSIDELVDKFDLSQVQKSGASFDEKRLLWMNGAHIRNLSLDELYELVKDKLPEDSKNFDEEYRKKVVGLLQERLKTLNEVNELSTFFFTEPKINLALIDEHKQLSKEDRSILKDWLNVAKETLSSSDFTVEDLTNKLNSLLEKTGTKPVVLFSLIRIATTHSPQSPGLFDTLNLLGKEKSIDRIEKTLLELK
jgi:glutamyl-tRNA synthetase